MSRTVTLRLPEGINSGEIRELLGELQGLSEVEETGSDTTRGIDAATMMMWITFAGEAIAAISAAVTILQSITQRIRRKGISGVVIELPNGARISVDSATPEEIHQIVENWKSED